MKVRGFGRTGAMNTADLLMSDVKKDLHIHTCYSDGVLTPEQVIDRWKDDGYELISITDHDGIEGSIIGMDYAAGVGIKFIPGIEFDSEDDVGSDLHILGYGIDYNCRKLNSALYDINIKRARRNDRLLRELNSLGYDISLDDIGLINEGRYVGKPTFALILKLKGFTDTPQEAFDSVFRSESVRGINKENLQSRTVVDIIHASGGLAVIAHPMEQRHPGESFDDFRPRLYRILDRMADCGIDGIECVHPSASADQSELLEEYAVKHGLITTTGSDFHADKSPRDFRRYHRP